MSFVNYPAILSGGHGVRLWPLSRRKIPKQFLPFFETEPFTLFGRTLQRINAVSELAKPIILINRLHREFAEQQLKQLKIIPHLVISEPTPRNTAVPVAIAAIAAQHTHPGALVTVTPCDHLIRKIPAFLKALKLAIQIASSGKFVLFGIRPIKPHAGYGYIRAGHSIPEFDDIFSVKEFIEKPPKKKTIEYHKDRSYFWNSGILVARAKDIIEELREIQPAILETAIKSFQQACSLGPRSLKLDKTIYSSAPNISNDKAVLEHTSRGVVLPVDIGWTDIGSWSSLWEVAHRDADDNYIKARRTCVRKTTGCYVNTQKRQVHLIGLKDLVIVETEDALLISNRDCTQNTRTHQTDT